MKATDTCDRTAMSHALVFLDTNAALHFRRADEIDWLELIGSTTATIIISSVFLRELELQKVQNPKKKLRDRARETVVWLHSRRREKVLRAGVDLLFVSKEPLIDFEALELDRTLYDDRLIAAAIAYRNEAPNADIWVATADLGLQLKLERFGISAIELPEALALLSEPDPDQRELERVSRELQRFQSRMPDLRLWFADSGPGSRIEVKVAEVSDYEAPEPLQAAKARHPLITGEMYSPGHGLEGSPAAPLGALLSAGSEAFKNLANSHNELVEAYYQQYSRFLTDHEDWISAERLTFEIRLVFGNGGTLPATDIDIDLIFPATILLLDNDDATEEPFPPSPPPPFPSFGLNLTTRNWYVERSTRADRSWVPNLLGDEPQIDHERGAVSFHISSLKHHDQLELGSFLCQFANQESVASFSIKLRITAAELLDPINEVLHVVLANEN